MLVKSLQLIWRSGVWSSNNLQSQVACPIANNFISTHNENKKVQFGLDDLWFECDMLCATINLILDGLLICNKRRS